MKHTLDEARTRDAADPLRPWREQFHFPLTPDGDKVIYMTGNSLGLQPVSTRERVLSVLNDWSTLGVEGHFAAGRRWLDYHRPIADRMAPIVGAQAQEVTVMNSLTVNLHLLLASFYRPEPGRYRIAIENHAFPSDRYAVRSHLAWHGIDPEDGLIIVGDDDVVSDATMDRMLKESGDSLALSLLGGVNYYSGQLFDIPGIARAVHEVGGLAGWDLAHAAGNVPLSLHDWDVDFAAWCSYKYMNAGPGGPSAIFVHDRHSDRPRLSGWWGHDIDERFTMPDQFKRAPGAEGWQLSNQAVLALAGLDASLDAFDAVGMTALHAKSRALTAWTIDCLDARLGGRVELVTPRDPERRGAQLSVRVLGGHGRQVFEELEARHVLCDWREPDIIRAAPVPLYNSFEDAYVFVERLAAAMDLV